MNGVLKHSAIFQEGFEQMKKNIILIGMPGAGKSTVGVVLAKKLGYRFIDSDLVIQEQTGKKLCEIIEEQGIDGFMKVEGEVNASLQCENTVIATGGSAIYEENGMEHLKKIGHVVYLSIPFEELEVRLGDLNERGVVLKPGYTLKTLFDERKPLYEKYADLTVQCEGKIIREIIREIAALTE